MHLPHAAADFALKAMNTAHRTVLAVSAGRIGRNISTMPVVELHTTGRVSGRKRSTMLTAPIHDATRTVVIASKGGDDRDPDWYRNLVADPDVELTVDGVTHQMHARTASAEEKAQLWPAVVAAYRGYDDYQRRTDRDIPVVVCEPRA